MKTFILPHVQFLPQVEPPAHPQRGHDHCHADANAVWHPADHKGGYCVCAQPADQDVLHVL